MCNSVVVLLRPDFPPLMNQRKTVSLSSKTHGLIMTTSLLVPVMGLQSFGSQDQVDRMEKGGRWKKAYHLKVPRPPMPPQPPRGSPRQRNIPTPRGVNMIFWSLDNRFVLVAIMDMMDARYSQFNPRLYIPKPPEIVAGKNTGPSSSIALQSHQIFCCAFNNSGTFFVTGCSDTCTRISDGCQGENLVRRLQNDIHIHELIVTPNLLEEK